MGNTCKPMAVSFQCMTKSTTNNNNNNNKKRRKKRILILGYPFPMQGDLPNPGIEPMSLVSPALAGGFFTPGSPGKPKERKKQVRKGETLVQRNRYKLFVLGSFRIPLLPTSVALSATRPTNTHPSSALTTDLYLIDYIKFLIFRTFFYIPSA